MGIVIDFPVEAAARRPGATDVAGSERGTVLILPVVRIERVDETNGSDPAEGTAPGRRRRRRARS
jgi:hypothetical protein